jgi:hypothetical protein
MQYLLYICCNNYDYNVGGYLRFLVCVGMKHRFVPNEIVLAGMREIVRKRRDALHCYTKLISLQGLIVRTETLNVLNIVKLWIALLRTLEVLGSNHDRIFHSKNGRFFNLDTTASSRALSSSLFMICSKFI